MICKMTFFFVRILTCLTKMPLELKLSEYWIINSIKFVFCGDAIYKVTGVHINRIGKKE